MEQQTGGKHFDAIFFLSASNLHLLGKSKVLTCDIYQQSVRGLIVDGIADFTVVPASVVSADSGHSDDAAVL